MVRLRMALLLCSIVLVAAGVLLPARPAAAQDPVYLPAGVACAFDLQIEFGGSPNPVNREFYDKDGTLVRFLSAGKGWALTFTNLASGATLSLKDNGSVSKTVFNADGSSMLEVMGHNVIILYPTDSPPGPSTTLYIGRVVIAISADQTWTLQSASGRSTDICAALSG